MSGQLGKGYHSLLLAIQDNPFGTIAELAESSGTSKPTVAKRISDLQAQRIFMVKPLLNDINLGFDFVDIFMETSDIKGVTRLEEIGDRHPYTSYTGRCFGAVNGALLQFRTPVGTRSLIEELAGRLVDDGTILKYQVVPVGGGTSVYSSLSIKGWDPNTLSWKFNWNDWFEEETRNVEIPQQIGKVGSVLEWFDDKDAQILYEVMHGVRRKNLDILQSMKERGITITPQTFSRRYQMIKEHCFSGYRVSFDSSVFDIYNNLVIVGKGSAKYIHKIQSKLYSNPIPFQSVLKVSGSNFFWYIRLQSSHLSALLSNLHSNLDSMQVSIIDYSHSYSYFVWPGNYDNDMHEWKKEKEYMIDDVLN